MAKGKKKKVLEKKKKKRLVKRPNFKKKELLAFFLKFKTTTSSSFITVLKIFFPRMSNEDIFLKEIIFYLVKVVYVIWLAPFK